MSVDDDVSSNGHRAVIERSELVSRRGFISPLNRDEEYLRTIFSSVTSQKNMYLNLNLKKEKNDDDEDSDYHLTPEERIQYVAEGLDSKAVWKLQQSLEMDGIVLLDLSHNRITNIGMHSLCLTLRHRINIQYINFNNTGIQLDTEEACNSPEGKALGDLLKDCPYLKELNLGNNRIGNSGCSMLVDSLTGRSCWNETLTLLELARSEMRNVAYSVKTPKARPAANRHAMKKLWLNHCRIEDAGCASIAILIESLWNLEEFDISFNCGTGAGAWALLTQLTRHDNIRCANLSTNGFGQPEFVEKLVGFVGSSPELEYLDLSYNMIWEDTGPCTFDAITHNPSLRKISLIGNSLDAKTIEDIQQYEKSKKGAVQIMLTASDLRSLNVHSEEERHETDDLSTKKNQDSNGDSSIVAPSAMLLDRASWAASPFGSAVGKMKSGFKDFWAMNEVKDVVSERVKKQKATRKAEVERGLGAALKAARVAKGIVRKYRAGAVTSNNKVIDAKILECLGRLAPCSAVPSPSDPFWEWKGPRQSTLMPPGTFRVVITMEPSINNTSIYCVGEPIVFQYSYQKAGLSRHLHSEDDWVGLFKVGNGIKTPVNALEGGRIDDVNGLIARVKTPSANTGKILWDCHNETTGQLQLMYVLGNTGSMVQLQVLGASSVFKVSPAKAKLDLPARSVSEEYIPFGVKLDHSLPTSSQNDFIAIFPAIVDTLVTSPMAISTIKRRTVAEIPRLLQRLPIPSAPFKIKGIPPGPYDIVYISSRPSFDQVSGSFRMHITRKTGMDITEAEKASSASIMTKRKLPTVKSREVRLYIGLSPQDMQMEIDIFEKNVAPALLKLCSELDVRISFLHVRKGWGNIECASEDEYAEKLSILADQCLMEMEQCLPFVITCIGHTYGPIVPFLRPSTVSSFPWIRGHKNKFVTTGIGMSLTELEITNALFTTTEPSPYIKIYQREISCSDLYGSCPRDTLKWEQAAMKNLKDRLQEHAPRCIRVYPHPSVFQRAAFKDFATMIETEFPKENSPSTQFIVAVNQQHHADRLLQRFVNRPAMSHALGELVLGSKQPVMVTGQPGVGKSALIADWCRVLVSSASRTEEILQSGADNGGFVGVKFWPRDGAASKCVIANFIGAHHFASSPQALLRRACTLLTLVMGSQEETRAFQSQERFVRLLKTARNIMEIFLVFDGLDSGNPAWPLQPLMSMIPDTLPNNVHVVCSSSSREQVAESVKRKWPQYTVEALTSTQKSEILEHFFSRFEIGVESSDVSKVLQSIPMGNPLALNLVLVDLKTADLKPGNLQLSSLVVRDSVRDIVVQILSSWNESWPNSVKMIQMLALSPAGLTETEFMALFDCPAKLPATAWLELRRMVEDICPRYTGVFVMSNAYLSKLIIEEMGSDKRFRMRSQLCDLFTTMTPGNPRQLDNLPSLLVGLEKWDELFSFVTQIDNFFLFYGNDHRKWEFMEFLDKTNRPLSETLQHLRRNFQDRFAISKRWFSDSMRSSNACPDKSYGYYELAPHLLANEHRLLAFTEYGVVLGTFYEDHGDHKEALELHESTLKLLFGVTDLESIAVGQCCYIDRAAPVMLRLAKLYLLHLGYVIGNDVAVLPNKPLEDSMKRFICRRLALIFAVANRQIETPHKNARLTLRNVLKLHEEAAKLNINELE